MPEPPLFETNNTRWDKTNVEKYIRWPDPGTILNNTSHKMSHTKDPGCETKNTPFPCFLYLLSTGKHKHPPPKNPEIFSKNLSTKQGADPFH